RRWRKVLGGGMRQAGILAAAGIVALTENVERLADDHANARRLAEGLGAIDGLAVDPAVVRTNMVFLCLPPGQAEALASFLRDRGILIAGRESIRLVTHHDVSATDIDRVVAAFGGFFRRP
ncbi:low-specificity L-threonine aldolase, partial [bacterium]|nr:low-specificity L-threonine aldolase [bacterium]